VVAAATAAIRSIVGRTIRLDGQDQTVIGHLPGSFRLWLPSEAFLITDSQIWKPLQFNYANQPPRNYTLFTGVRAAESRRHLRAGAGGDGEHRDSSSAPSIPSSRTATCASASSRCRTTWSSTRGGAIVSLFVGGRLRAADRVRQRRAPAPRARDGARA
jgi:hypothetical protein